MFFNVACCIHYSISVHLSVTCRYCVNEHRMMLSSLVGSTMHLDFGDIRFINIFTFHNNGGERVWPQT